MFPLTKWNPFKELSSLHTDIDDLFGRTFGRTGLPALFTEGYRYPAMDCAMKGDNFVVHVELPGIDPKDVDITVTGNLLTVKGERKLEKEVKEEEYLVREIGYGSFERTITLPHGVNADKVKANYVKGILEITMPAEAAIKGKKVPIELTEEHKKLKAA